MSDLLDDCISGALSVRRENHLLRSRRVVTPIDATHVLVDGQTLVNFASNNYLGLTHHPAMMQAIDAASGAGAAGLITGHTPDHAAAESAIASWKQTESALLMPSGYQSNLAAIQTLYALAKSQNRSIRFIVDKLAHASLIDAIRQSSSADDRQAMRVFPHNDISKIERLIKAAPEDELQVVVTESIFSMDGDAADLKAIAALKQRYDFALLVDEAHGSGVYGPAGSGLVAELGLRDAVDISIVTLSKALGVSGGAICGSQAFIDSVLNFGRAYIYSTAVSPLIARLVLRALQILRDEPDRQRRVRDLAKRVRTQLTDAGLSLPPGDSPIIPILLHSESQAIDFAKQLNAQGLLIMPVRPPTVPIGTSRLRITLSSQHTDAEIQHLVTCLLA